MADLPEYIKNTNTNDEIILSGLMEFDYEDIKKRGEELGLTLVSKKQRNEWIALKWNKE